jgi:hypothetical protein
MNRVTLIFTAISIVTVLTSCAGSQAQQANIANQQSPEQQGKSAEVIQQEQRQLAELQSVCAQIRLEEIDCVVGPPGESNSEQMAMKESLFNARVLLAQSLETKIKAEVEQIASNVNKEAQTSLVEKATGSTEQTLNRAFSYSTKPVYDGKEYKVYTLLVVNPEDLKNLYEASAMATGNEEMVAQVKSPEVQKSFFEKILVYKDKVVPILKNLALKMVGL